MMWWLGRRRANSGALICRRAINLCLHTLQSHTRARAHTHTDGSKTIKRKLLRVHKSGSRTLHLFLFTGNWWLGAEAPLWFPVQIPFQPPVRPSLNFGPLTPRVDQPWLRRSQSRGRERGVLTHVSHDYRPAPFLMFLLLTCPYL